MDANKRKEIDTLKGTKYLVTNVQSGSGSSTYSRKNVLSYMKNFIK
ncbi:hypothetical protein [Paenibacillus medicaginis]|uniref:Uncharacterized protein n=1 Tax=Paenibacillus medicaginis TaxID=1470560 RepID=A0ABV5C0Y8_9BACL